MCVFFDLETGPQPSEQLKEFFVPKTLAEFVGDRNWKEETAKAKYEEYLAGAFNDFIDSAALDAATCRILAIGYRNAEGKTAVESLDDKRDESNLICSFWKKFNDCAKKSRPMIGANIFGFDLPVIIRRSWILGIEFPSPREGRYWHRSLVDIRENWLLGQRWGESPSSLDYMARAMGIPGKPKAVIDGIEVCGKSFHKLYFGTSEQRTAAIDYLIHDLEMTAEISKRIGAI